MSTWRSAPPESLLLLPGSLPPLKQQDHPLCHLQQPDPLVASGFLFNLLNYLPTQPSTTLALRDPLWVVLYRQVFIFFSLPVLKHCDLIYVIIMIIFVFIYNRMQREVC